MCDFEEIRKYIQSFTMVVHEKTNVKHKKIKKTSVPTIILYNYILHKCNPTYMGIFPVYLRRDLIFTDFLTLSGSLPCAMQEICKYLMHPLVNWENLHIGQITLM